MFIDKFKTSHLKVTNRNMQIENIICYVETSIYYAAETKERVLLTKSNKAMQLANAIPWKKNE